MGEEVYRVGIVEKDRGLKKEKKEREESSCKF